VSGQGERRDMIDSVETRLILSMFVVLFFLTFSLYHLMVFGVNQHVREDETFSHSLSLGQRERLRDLYESLYPDSSVYQFTVTGAVLLMVFAVLFVFLRIWSYANS